MPPASSSLAAVWAPSLAVDVRRPLAASDPHNCTSLPISLLRPFLALFECVELPRPDHFLAGLRAESLLGARVLPARDPHQPSLAWVGATVHAPAGRLFDALHGGCWVPGFPRVGHGCELLSRARLANAGQWADFQRHLGLAASGECGVYFNFPADLPGSGWTRIYLLDAPQHIVQGLALPSSALAGKHRE